MDTLEELRAENEKLKNELAALREAARRRAEAGAALQKNAVWFSRMVILGGELDAALTRVFERLAVPATPTPVELAAVTGAVIRRLIRVGLVAFFIALVPSILSMAQTSAMFRQNQIMLTERSEAKEREQIRALATAKGFQMRLKHIFEPIKNQTARLKKYLKRAEELAGKEDSLAVIERQTLEVTKMLTIREPLIGSAFEAAPELARQLETSPDLFSRYPDVHEKLHAIALSMEHLTLLEKPPKRNASDKQQGAKASATDVFDLMVRNLQEASIVPWLDSIDDALIETGRSIDAELNGLREQEARRESSKLWR